MARFEERKGVKRMAIWRIQRLDTGAYYVGTGNKGIQWTTWDEHAAFGDRTHMLSVAQWLRSQGFKVKVG